jgi:RNA polymerase sigma-70 factor (ECF subfamily)
LTAARGNSAINPPDINPPDAEEREESDRHSAPGVPSFHAIYDKYFDFVWSSARRFGIGPDALDDVVQEVFIVIHSRLHTLEQPEAMRSWVYGIVRRTVSGYWRSRFARIASRERLALLEASRGSNQPTPLELAEKSNGWTLLASLLEGIDEAKREVFVLAELEEMTVPEIAQALQIPLNTAYSRLRAARQSFEERLARLAAREKAKGQ